MESVALIQDRKTSTFWSSLPAGEINGEYVLVKSKKTLSSGLPLIVGQIKVLS